MDPYTTAQWQALLLRERELQVAYSEYAFLAMCGGVRDEDLRRLRAAVVPTTMVVVKIEDDPPPPPVSGGYTPLKQMIREERPGAADGELNALCRRVRLACGDGLRIVKRHQAVFVADGDRAAVRAALGVLGGSG